MVPVHDSDVAENRWREGEWRQFELWERIEQRLRRKRTWIISGVVFVFLGLLAAPVIQDRVPQWRASQAMRMLAVRINQMKIDSASLGVPLRLRLEASAEGPSFQLEKVESCVKGEEGKVLLWGGGSLFEDAEVARQFVVLDEAAGVGLDRLTTEFCYDPLRNEPLPTGPFSREAMGLAIAKDLTDRRADRFALLNFTGQFAEIDFD